MNKPNVSEQIDARKMDLPQASLTAKNANLGRGTGGRASTNVTYAPFDMATVSS